MEKLDILNAKRQAVMQALACLQESLEFLQAHKHDRLSYKIARNSAIQCFEFSIDTIWKFLNLYAIQQHEIAVENPTPKKVFRQCCISGLITQEELTTLINIIDDRNITSHTYHEEAAEEICQKLPTYYSVLHTIMVRLA
jgi:nucleotidyltransferase substrate binding protein (TIGR01987 family)